MVWFTGSLHLSDKFEMCGQKLCNRRSYHRLHHSPCMMSLNACIGHRNRRCYPVEDLLWILAYIISIVATKCHSQYTVCVWSDERRIIGGLIPPSDHDSPLLTTAMAPTKIARPPA